MQFSSLTAKILSRSSNSAAAAFRRNFHASSSCWEKLNVEGLAKKVDLDGKNVLVRVDLNVPLAKVCVRKCSIALPKASDAIFEFRITAAADRFCAMNY